MYTTVERLSADVYVVISGHYELMTQLTSHLRLAGFLQLYCTPQNQQFQSITEDNKLRESKPKLQPVWAGRLAGGGDLAAGGAVLRVCVGSAVGG